MLVIARAYGDQPLVRLVTGERGKLAYLLNPSVADANGITPFSGVGFPLDAVFSFDQNLAESLGHAWEQDDKARLAALWSDAKPLAH